MMDDYKEKFSVLMDELGPSSANIVLIEQAAPQ
jgi:hypothetical protein